MRRLAGSATAAVLLAAALLPAALPRAATPSPAFFSPADSAAKWLPDSGSAAVAIRGLGFIYNFKFDSAETDLRAVAAAHPNHPGGHFLLGAVDWWRIMSDIDDKSLDGRFLERMDAVVGLCDDLLEADPRNIQALFFKSGALGFQGRLHGNREDWIRAAAAGREALGVMEETWKLAPGDADVKFGMGIYNYYAAMIPERYPFVKPFMVLLPDGDRKKGLLQLNEAASGAQLASTEAEYFLVQILFNFEKNYATAFPIARRLHAAHPANPQFHRYYGRVSAALGIPDADSIFTEILRLAASGRKGYGRSAEREARFYAGSGLMRQARYDEALDHFYRCDELSRTADAGGSAIFMTMANLKIGMIYDLQLKRDLAIAQYRKVLAMEDVQSSHEKAKAYLAAPYGG